MKKIIFTTILCLLRMVSFCQAPQAFSYQAIAYNNSNVKVITPISLEVSIHDGSLTGTIIYTERFTSIQPTNQGVFSLNIGQGVPQGTFNFSNINWGVGSKYLEVKIDPTNPGTGTNYTVIGGNQLMSVPYALYADF